MPILEYVSNSGHTCCFGLIFKYESLTFNIKYVYMYIFICTIDTYIYTHKQGVLLMVDKTSGINVNHSNA